MDTLRRRALSRARRGRRLALVLSAALLASLGQAGEAPGHAIVMDSSPRQGEETAAPRRLVLRFNSRIEKRLCSATLIAPDRRSIPLAGPEPGTAPDTLTYTLPDLAAGPYRVRWRVLAVDGHLTEGVLPFTVTRP